MLRASPQDSYEVASKGGRALSGAPPFKAWDLVLHLTASFRPIGNSRVPWSIVSVFLGMYLNSAVAAIEDVNQDSGEQNESLSTLSGGLSKDIYDNIAVQNVNNNQLDNDLIPATVWNIQDNLVDSVFRIRDGRDSEVYTGFSGQIESVDAWFRTATNVWGEYSKYTSNQVLLTVPLQFQVASCGGDQAEHKDLDRCTQRNDSLLEETTRSNILGSEGNSSTISGAAATGANSSTNTTASNANDQSIQPSPTTAFISNPVSSLIGNALSKDDLIVLAHCDISSAACTSVQISPPATSIALLAPVSQSSSPTPLDLPNPGDQPPGTDLSQVLAPSPVVPMIVALEPIADPLTPDLPLEPFAALPLASDPLKPIPEASTWVMTVIGSCFMAILFRKRGRRRANPISIIDVPEIS